MHSLPREKKDEGLKPSEQSKFFTRAGNYCIGEVLSDKAAFGVLIHAESNLNGRSSDEIIYNTGAA